MGGAAELIEDPSRGIVTVERASLARLLQPRVVAFAVSLVAAIHFIWLMASSHETIVCFIADDAFYELQLARHFLATGRWSFDNGFSTTTGFHLLNVYLMSLAPWLFANPWLAIKFWMTVGFALYIATVFVICDFTSRTWGTFSLIGTIPILIAPSLILQSTGLLEFPFVVLIAACYVRSAFRFDGRRALRRELLVLGAIGSLARSDFGGLPLAIFMACAVSFYFRRDRERLVASAYGLVGATAALIATFLHSYAFSGHFLSGSVRAKALWGARLGYSPGRAIGTALLTLTNSGHRLAILIALAFAVFALAAAARGLSQILVGAKTRPAPLDGEPDNRLLAGAGLVAIAIYFLAYGADPAQQLWYTANFLVPFVLIFGSALSVANRSLVGRACAVAVLVPWATANVTQSYQPTWKHQRYMLEMADYIRAQSLQGRIGGWNVGIVGFFLDGRVVNLDGLMNDSILPSMQDGTVEHYLDQNKIEYLVDFPRQIDDQKFSNVLGFGGALGSHLVALHTIRNIDRDDQWLDYTLYKRE